MGVEPEIIPHAKQIEAESKKRQFGGSPYCAQLDSIAATICNLLDQIGAIDIPILYDISQITGLLTGTPAKILSFGESLYCPYPLCYYISFKGTIPFGFDGLSFPVVVDLEIFYNNGGAFRIGYDTAGIQRYRETHDITKLFDGFYIDPNAYGPGSIAHITTYLNVNLNLDMGLCKFELLDFIIFV